MRSFWRYTTILLMGLIILSCEKDDLTKRPFPRLQTLPVTEISAEGVTFNARIIYRGDFEIIDYGFVWSLGRNPRLESSDRVIHSENIQEDQFSLRVSRAMFAGGNFHVRAFATTEDYVIYGEAVPYESLGGDLPVITGFSPQEVFYGDTLSILGLNFSSATNANKVKLGESDWMNVLTANDTLVKIVIPLEHNQKSFIPCILSIGGETCFSDSVAFKSPVITDLSKTQVVIGDTIDITGKYFGLREDHISLSFNESFVEMLEADSTHIRAVVPVVSEPIVIAVTNSLGLVGVNHDLRLATLEILAISPIEGYYGDEVEIIGQNFGHTSTSINVEISGTSATINSASNGSIKFALPLGIYDARDVTVSVLTGGNSVTAPQTFKVLNSMIKKTNVPHGQFGRNGATAFSVGQYGYMGLGGGKGLEQYLFDDFWEYNPETNTWQQIANFPGGPRSEAACFTIGQYAYIGTGNTGAPKADFWRYDTQNDQWQQIANFPVPAQRATGLSAGSLGYLCLQQDIDNFWQYDPATDQWAQLPDLITISAGAKGKADTGFALDGTIYIYAAGGSTGLKQLYAYDITSSTWSRRSDMPGHNIRTNVTGFTLGDKGHIVAPFALYIYTPHLDSWEQISLDPFSIRDHASSFTLDNKAYFGSGINHGRGIDFVDFWEYNSEFDD